VSAGLIVKPAVAAATTSNIAATYSGGPAFTLTVTGTGTPSIDGLSVTTTGTRVLIKDQTSGAENGIYTLTTAAAPGVSAVFTRAADYDSDAEVVAGTFVFVLSGSTNADKQFAQTTPTPTLDSSSLVFTVLNDTTIADGTVTNAKLADMAGLRLKGAVTSGTPQDLTANQAISILNSGTTRLVATVLATGSTSASGIVQLYDGTDNVSQSLAATANSVKTLRDATVPSSGGTFTGPIVAPTGSTISGHAKFDEAQTFTKAQRGAIVALAGSGTVTPDFSLSNNFAITLSGAVTLAFPSGVASGQSGAIRIEQNGTHVITYSGAWEFPDSTAPNNSVVSGQSDLLVYYAHSNRGITAQLLTNVG